MPAAVVFRLKAILEAGLKRTRQGRLNAGKENQASGVDTMKVREGGDNEVEGDTCQVPLYI